MQIRDENAVDFGAIRALLTSTFPTEAEADLVDQLRHDRDAVIGLVAVPDGAVAGHIMLSRMTAPMRAVGLAPLAVTPSRQRQGTGSALVAHAIGEARAMLFDAVFVLGDPAYYGRFGFSAETAAAFESPYAGPYFMALALMGDLESFAGGKVDYARAFARFERD